MRFFNITMKNKKDIQNYVKKHGKDVVLYGFDEKITKLVDKESSLNKIIKEMGLKEGLDVKVVLKNLLMFYEELYLEGNKYLEYTKIDKFLNFMHENFEFTLSPNNIYGRFVELQFDLNKNKKYLKEYFKNYQNNINPKENMNQILDIFNFDYENKNNIKEFVRIFEANKGSFKGAIKDIIKWKQQDYFESIGPKTFLQYMKNPKGFNYDKDTILSLDAYDENNILLRNKIALEQEIEWNSKYEFIDSTDLRQNGFEIGYKNKDYVDEINKGYINLDSLNDLLYKNLLEIKNQWEVLEEDFEYIKPIKQTYEETIEELRIKKEMWEKEKIKQTEQLYKRLIVQEHDLNKVFQQNKKTSVLDFKDLPVQKSIEFFTKYSRDNFKNKKQALIFLNLFKMYVNSKEKGEEFFLLKIMEEYEISVFKDGRTAQVKDFENMLTNFGNMLSEIKDVEGNKVNLSYMLQDLLKKVITPYDMHMEGEVPKFMKTEVSFKPLKVKKDKALLKTLNEITTTISSKFDENSKIVKSFSDLISDIGQISDKNFLKLFDLKEIENIFKYYSSNDMTKNMKKYDSLKEIKTLSQKLLFLMEVQKDLIRRKFFSTPLLWKILEIENMDIRNELLNLMFEQYFSDYYSDSEKEVIIGRGTLQSQLYDIKFNFYEYKDGADVTDPNYKQNRSLTKALELAKTFRDQLKEIIDLDEKLSKTERKQIEKNRPKTETKKPLKEQIEDINKEIDEIINKKIEVEPEETLLENIKSSLGTDVSTKR